jgi:hypothetical protein
MSALETGLAEPKAGHAYRVRPRESFFALFGGPVAWFLQLCAGYALASEPCFRDGYRVAAPLPALQWTWPAMILVMALAIAISLLSLLVSWRTFKRTREDGAGDAHQSISVSEGRTRFLALWGVLLGSGFALATTFTAVAFLTLPRCAG